MRQLNDREVAMLLGGLRLLQEQHEALPDGVFQIVDEGCPDGVDEDEIDQLCEAINVGRFRRATGRRP